MKPHSIITHLSARAALLAALDRIVELAGRAERGDYGLKGSVTSAYTDDSGMVRAAFASFERALDDVARAITGRAGSDLQDAEDDIVRRFWANCDADEAANGPPEPESAARIAIMRRCGALV